MLRWVITTARSAIVRLRESMFRFRSSGFSALIATRQRSPYYARPLPAKEFERGSLYPQQDVDMNPRLWKMVDRKFRKSDIEGAIRSLESALAKENVAHFKGLTGAQFSNSPAAVLSRINKFIRECSKHFNLSAVYLEMNGFDINYNGWSFDFFGYERYGADPDDIEWLCDWQSELFPEVELKGLERQQKEFKWYHENEIWNDKGYEKCYEISLLLVMAKFVLLIESALDSGKLAKEVPVIATAHDFDIVGRFVS
jgi:hypothetical protein